MTDIYEFLSALHQGIWEVIIPKELLTVPLGPEWKFSPINVPSKETIASYRNGQYHLHETKNEYRVHLDRYDPEKNPLLHLLDDAPLILMISETLQTIYVTARDAKKNTEPDFIKDQRLTWVYRMAIGIILLVIGGIFALIALNQDIILFNTLLPSIVSFSGILILGNGIMMRRRKEHSRKDVVTGLLLICGGILMFFLWELYLVIMLLILAVWFFGSAYVTLSRIIKEKKQLPRGLWLPIGLGVCSLALGILTIIAPDILLEILVGILSVIICIIGIGFLLDGYGLRNAEGLMTESPKNQESQW